MTRRLPLSSFHASRRHLCLEFSSKAWDRNSGARSVGAKKGIM